MNPVIQITSKRKSATSIYRRTRPLYNYSNRVGGMGHVRYIVGGRGHKKKKHNKIRTVVRASTALRLEYCSIGRTRQLFEMPCCCSPRAAMGMHGDLGEVVVGVRVKVRRWSVLGSRLGTSSPNTQYSKP